MKTHKKSKFYYLWDDGTKKPAKNGDSYFRFEWRFKKKFPFLKKELVHYKLIDNIWKEQV